MQVLSLAGEDICAAAKSLTKKGKNISFDTPVTENKVHLLAIFIGAISYFHAWHTIPKDVLLLTLRQPPVDFERPVQPDPVASPGRARADELPWRLHRASGVPQAEPTGDVGPRLKAQKERKVSLNIYVAVPEWVFLEDKYFSIDRHQKTARLLLGAHTVVTFVRVYL